MTTLATGARRKGWPFRRLALGFSPTPRPGLVLLAVGIGLGPHGLGVLTPSVVASLDPVVSMALAALGVLVGLGIDVRRPREFRLLAAATIESGITVVCVTAGAGFVLRLLGMQASWPLALMLGICAASSSTPAMRAPDESSDDDLHRIGDLDDVLPIVLSAVALAWSRSTAPLEMAALLGQVIGIAVLVALVAWLLLTQTAAESEQRVFVIGTLLLLGGAAAYLRLSALFLGLVAALCWNASGEEARDVVARDTRYLQHPLMVLILVDAGARVELSNGVMLLLAAYVALRITGKLLGGWMASRLDRELPRDFGLSLTAPGAIGVSIALNAFQSSRDSQGAASLLLVVAAGSLVLELLSYVTSGRGDRP